MKTLLILSLNGEYGSGARTEVVEKSILVFKEREWKKIEHLLVNEKNPTFKRYSLLKYLGENTHTQISTERSKGERIQEILSMLKDLPVETTIGPKYLEVKWNLPIERDPTIIEGKFKIIDLYFDMFLETGYSFD
jgi:hypothetical protein